MVQLYYATWRATCTLCWLTIYYLFILLFFFSFSSPFAYLFLVFLFPSGKFVTLNNLYKVINREMVRVFTKPPIGLSANFLFYHFTSALVWWLRRKVPIFPVTLFLGYRTGQNARAPFTRNWLSRSFRSNGEQELVYNPLTDAKWDLGRAVFSRSSSKTSMFLPGMFLFSWFWLSQKRDRFFSEGGP